MTKQRMAEIASEVCHDLVRKHGIECTRAAYLTANAVVRAVKQPIVSALGQAEEPLPAPIQAVKQTVTPYLWTLPIFGFALQVAKTLRGR